MLQSSDCVSVDTDILWLPVDPMFFTDESLRENSIGIGDDLFIVGLFTPVMEESRTCPILNGNNSCYAG